MSSSPSDSSTTPLPAEGLRVYLKPRVIGMLFLGFSAGLPLLLVGGTFSAWLRDIGVELASIGFLSWVLIWVGWYAGAQITIIHLLNIAQSLADDFDWGFFLIEPMIFIISV